MQTPQKEASEQRRDPQRLYLTVPYLERKAAKTAGAKWDSIAKSWYAGPQADMEQLKRWLPENVKNEQFPAMTPREEFAEALRSVGCIVEGEHPLMDGAAHRIRTEGDRAEASSGFYVAYMDGRPAGYVKNNRTGEEVRWKTQGAFISQQDETRRADSLSGQERTGSPKRSFFWPQMEKRLASLLLTQMESCGPCSIFRKTVQRDSPKTAARKDVSTLWAAWTPCVPPRPS